jgi:SAM-dependent methyltransferase
MSFIESIISKQLLSRMRLWRLRPLFPLMSKHMRGDVLDIGGRDFFLFAKGNKNIVFSSWTSLDLEESVRNFPDKRYKMIVGDGEKAPFPDKSFDTILNIQVMEHTLHPDKMLSEIKRLLRDNGVAIIVVPQNAAMHEIPTHYYNFTRYWVEKAFPEAGLVIKKFIPIGGKWSTHASHMFDFFLKAFRWEWSSSPDYKRNFLFYILSPFMIVYAFFGIIIGLLFSFGDLTEDPNNLIIVATK